MTIWQPSEWIGLPPKLLRSLAQLEANPFPMDAHWRSDPEAVRAWLRTWGLGIDPDVMTASTPHVVPCHHLNRNRTQT
ncbi:MAG: hypothetical protein ACYCOU_16390 [Sulfobacillus sp.]